MALVLHSGMPNKNAFKALIAAEYSGIKIEVTRDFQMGVSNKSLEFLKMNPLGKVPVLETSNGPVFESNAIARFVTRLKADNPLYGSSLIEYAQIEQWVDFSTTEIDSNIARWLYPRLGKSLGQLKESVKNKEVRQAKEEIPHPKLVEAVIEEEEVSKPKDKNPLDLLPPSKMILDDWKRLYSNTKTNFREVAIKGFWEMYDPEGYSLWFCDYKYNEENTITFVTLNKVSGFLQRMDHARKYSFGLMLVIGSEPPYKVKGFWLFRGSGIPRFVIDECYDVELYEWSKVDIADEAQKERVNAMIEDLEPFEGEALLDAKCFK